MNTTSPKDILFQNGVWPRHLNKLVTVLIQLEMKYFCLLGITTLKFNVSFFSEQKVQFILLLQTDYHTSMPTTHIWVLFEN